MLSRNLNESTLVYANQGRICQCHVDTAPARHQSSGTVDMAGHVGGVAAGKDYQGAFQLAGVAASSHRHPPLPASELNDSSVISVRITWDQRGQAHAAGGPFSELPGKANHRTLLAQYPPLRGWT